VAQILGFVHQIVCRLGLRRRPHWGSLQRSPDPIAALGVGPPGKKRREGREWRESRNSLIQSYQA